MIDIEELSLDGLLNENFSFVTEEIQEKAENTEQNLFPILPVRDMVMFPKIIMPITAGREKSIKLLQDAQLNNEVIGIISQKMLKSKTLQRKIYTK